MNKRLKNINHWQTHVEPPSELKENKIISKIKDTRENSLFNEDFEFQ